MQEGDLTAPFSPFDVTLPQLPMATSRHKPAAIAVFVSCVAMLVGGVSFDWFTHGKAGLGLIGLRACIDDMGCHTITWLEAQGAPASLLPLGLLGVVGLGASILLAIHAGVMLFQGKRVHRVVLDVALLVAALAVVGFWYAVFRSSIGNGTKLGYAGFLAIAGIAGAGLAVHLGVKPGRAAR